LSESREETNHDLEQHPTSQTAAPLSREISDLRNAGFTPCTHAQRNTLHIKYAEKTDD